MILKIFKTSIDKKQEDVKNIDFSDLSVKMRGLLGSYSEFAEIILRKCFSVMQHYPASVSHHNSLKGGLWIHSVDVAFKMAEEFQAQSTKKAFIAFVVGLLHDIGKIGFFEVKTLYSYHHFDFSFIPPDVNVTAKTQENDRHAELSTILVYHFISDVIHCFTVRDLLDITDAIRLHHTKVVSENEYYDSLRKVDADITSEELKAVIQTETTETVNETVKQNSETVLETRNISLDIFKTLLRKKIKRGDLLPDYHFYIINYASENVMLITAPKVFHEICDEYCKETQNMFHDSMFIDALKENKYIALLNADDTSIVNVRITINKKERNLKYVALFADLILSQDEIKQYFSKAEKISTKAILQQRVVANYSKEDT